MKQKITNARSKSIAVFEQTYFDNPLVDLQGTRDRAKSAAVSDRGL